MNNCIKKILLINLIIILFISSIAFANPFSDYTSNDTNNTEIEDVGGKVLGIINVVGTAIAICVLLFIGMKFMIAAPSERANLKGTLVPYIVGAVLLFAAVGISSIIYNFSDKYIK